MNTEANSKAGFQGRSTAEDKPENGIKGLKHWKSDLLAGLIVSLVSVPLSLGIAVASGAPPICGLISSIIAGLIFPFLGGAYMTISGPAAGLAPVVLGSMAALGHGNLEVGYKLVLAVICLAGVVQLILSYFKAARFSVIFPAAAIQAMLASIGLMIIAKQIPNFIGHAYKSHEFFGMIAETPSDLLLLNPAVFFVSISCLILLFALSSSKKKNFKLLPPQLLAVALGIVLGQLLQLDSKFLIQIPDNVLKHGIVLPDFAGLFNNQSLWFTALSCVLTLTMVDGFESLATIMAIDKIDPFKRTSSPNRTLTAMGVSNICSSLLGGLTIIPGGIKSTTCIISGGKTLWANFYNAVFLICYLFIAKDLINLIPLGTLAAILIHIGYKLCAPRKWIEIADLGREQLIIFASTVIMTLQTDLLWGLLFGTCVKFFILLTLGSKAANDTLSLQERVKSLIESAHSFFKSPLAMAEEAGPVYRIDFSGPLVCFNALAQMECLEKAVKSGARTILIRFSDKVSVVDHSSMERLRQYADKFEENSGKKVIFDGLESMSMRSAEYSCMRISRSMPVFIKSADL